MFALAILGFFGLLWIGSSTIWFFFQRGRDVSKDSPPFGIMSGVFAAIFMFFLLYFGHTFIANQHVGFAKVFGVVVPDKTYSPGFHFKPPWENIDQVDMAIDTQVFGAGEGALPILEGMTEDQVFLQVDVATTWSIVPENVPLFKSKFGLKGLYSDQVYSIVRSAVRDTIAQTSWKSGGVTNRNGFALAIQKNIEAKTEDFFKQAGMGAESGNMIKWGAINLRKIVPPHKIQESNNDLAAADIQDQLQTKLLKVEQSRNAVRKEQAQNYNSLVRVPEGMDPSKYAEVLRATTEQMNAETLANALENGKQVSVVVGLGISPVPTSPIK